MAENIYLASRWGNPKSFKEIDEFVGGLKNIKIAFIPTAANGEFGYDWEGGSMHTYLKENNCDYKILNLDKDRYDFRKELEDCDAVLVHGGSPTYLLYWLNRMGYAKILKEFILKGLKYVGSSAGSMILGQSMEVCKFFPGEEEEATELSIPLKLVDFDMVPHYVDEFKPIIEKSDFKGSAYLMRDGEAIIFKDGVMSFSGNPVLITK